MHCGSFGKILAFACIPKIFNALINLKRQELPLLSIYSRLFQNDQLNGLPKSGKLFHWKPQISEDQQTMAHKAGFTGTRVGFDIINSTTVSLECTEPVRLPDFLRQWLPATFPSASAAKKACRKKEVLVNGKVTLSAETVVAGDVVQRQVRSKPGFSSTQTAPFSMDVVYEDDYIAVVVKPPGISVHGEDGYGNTGKTVRSCLPHILKPSAATDHALLRRPLHVHRLDKLTGGLLVAAKTQEALASTSQQFRERGCMKRYRALLAGRLEGSGIVEVELDGKPSLTEFSAIEHTPSKQFGGWVTTADLFPKTGRRHQLRRHMAHIGHPIIGDSRYSNPSGDKKIEDGCMFLWALELSFLHPSSNTQVNAQIGEPNHFQMWREKQQKQAHIV